MSDDAGLSLTAPAPLAEIGAALRSGQRDLAAYIDAVCDRLAATEPRVRALLPEPQRRARLQREAAALVQRHPDPGTRPPLFGVLVGVKDIFNVDGFPTSAGSALPSALFEGPEADAVRRLRRAGALVLGKTVTTEFAYFEAGGTANPHNPAHTPGGSSSGSAAVVATGVPLALGSQTVGSVIRPAAFCGVVGFKPSYGRIPISGVLAFAKSVDHVGCFTQDVAGAALAASVLCDAWRADADEADSNPTLGVPEGPYLDQAGAEAREAFEAQLTRLAERGIAVRRLPALRDIGATNACHRRLIAAEFAQVHADWFRDFGPLYRGRSAMLVEQGRAVGDADQRAAREHTLTLRRELESRMDEGGIDLWVSPAATGPAPSGLASTGDPALNLPWTHAGLPSLTLPSARSGAGLPLGLQLSARFLADERLLRWAARIEALL